MINFSTIIPLHEGFFDWFKKKKEEPATSAAPTPSAAPTEPEKTIGDFRQSRPQKPKVQGPKFVRNLIKISEDFSHVKLSMGSGGNLNFKINYEETDPDQVYMTLQEIKLLKSAATEEKRDFREKKAELRYARSQEVANQAPIQSMLGYGRGAGLLGNMARVSKGLQRASRQADRSRHLEKVEAVNQQMLIIDKIIAILKQQELKVKKHWIQLKESADASLARIVELSKK